MSMARKCDKCDALFEPVKGCVNVEQIHVISGKKLKDGSPLESGWSDVDLCLKCSAPVIEALRGACTGIEKYKVRVPAKG